jgi:hypothetical protein
MSLINDALKRARETEQPRAGESPPPLQPVDYAARPHRAAWIVLIVLLVATLGFAAFYLSRWAGSSAAGRAGGTSNDAVAASLASPEEVAAPAVRPAIKVTTNLMARQASVPRSDLPTAPASASPASSAPPTAEPRAAIPEPSQAERTSSPGEGAPAAVNPVAQVEARFPELKLQSIVFRLRNPSVLIDGEMLGAGDTVKGARVVKIERHAVTMEWQGQTNVLRLPQF